MKQTLLLLLEKKMKIKFFIYYYLLFFIIKFYKLIFMEFKKSNFYSSNINLIKNTLEGIKSNINDLKTVFINFLYFRKMKMFLII